MPGPSFCAPTDDGSGRGTAKPDRTPSERTSPWRILAAHGEPSQRHQRQRQGDDLGEGVPLGLRHQRALLIRGLLGDLAHLPHTSYGQRRSRNHHHRQKESLESAVVAFSHTASRNGRTVIARPHQATMGHGLPPGDRRTRSLVASASNLARSFLKGPVKVNWVTSVTLLGAVPVVTSTVNGLPGRV